MEKKRKSSTVSLEDVRYFVNPYNDFSLDNSDRIIDLDKNDIKESFKRELTEKTEILLKKFQNQKSKWNNRDDPSVYTGLAGIAFMFYQYGNYFHDASYICKAAEMLCNYCLTDAKSKRQITFLTGKAGPLALGAVIYHKIDKEKSQKMIHELESLFKYIPMEEDSQLPDELLYGRAGYLYSLLFVNSNISPAPVSGNFIRKIVEYILNSGRNYSRKIKSTSPLMYSWHDKEYLGGAHGLCGILYMLLQAHEHLTHSELYNEIEASLKYLQNLAFTSGNFPSSLGNQSDKLVHWCHGAPSMTMLFTLAHKIFRVEKYLQTSLKCGEVVWDRGLLKKGCGICHGVAGNAYTFLNLFQKTKNPKYLYRACQFAVWCFDYESHQTRIPDRPFSLFEGMAGTIYFLIDLQKPMLAKFPGYTL